MEIIKIFRNFPPKLKKILIQSLKLLVTILVLYIIVQKLGWNNIVTNFKKINPLYAFYGLACCVVSIVLGALQWHLIMNHKNVKIKFRETFELYYIGMFFNNIGTLAGDTLKVAYIKTRHSLGKLGFATTFLDRFAGLLTLALFAGCGCLYLVVNGEFHSPNEIFVAKFVICFLCFMGFMSSFLVMRRLRKLLIFIIDKLPIPKKQVLGDIVHASGFTIHQLPFIFGIGGLSILIQALRIGTHIFSAAALGILTAHNIVYFFIFIPLVALIMIVPLPFGIREAVGGSLFSLTGIPVESAFIMQFMATFIGIIGSLWGGVEFLINVPKNKNKDNQQTDKNEVCS